MGWFETVLLRIMVFPTWVVCWITIRFVSKEHIWYKQNFSLSDWAEHSTMLTRELGLLLWVSGGSASLLLYLIFFTNYFHQ